MALTSSSQPRTQSFRSIRKEKPWLISCTRISFDLKQAGDHAIVLFKHQGWKEPVEFMHYCSTKWAIYLMSLKSLVETGRGTPNPNDTHISGDGPD
jgi:hypothetical protein